MASLSVNINPSGYYSANVFGTFTGGDATFGRRTMTVVYQSSGGGGSVNISADQASGATSTFSGQITGLDDGTTYTWTAMVNDPNGTATDSGSFTTPAGPPPVYTGPVIRDGNDWYAPTPIVWDGSAWNVVTGKINYGGWRP